MPKFKDTSFTVYCRDCLNELEADDLKESNMRLYVNPCKKCLQDARDEVTHEIDNQRDF